MNKTKRRIIFERLRSANPTPTTELQFSSSFELLIAVILSAQATDIRVNIATSELFAVACTPQAMVDMGEERLKHYIKSIGLYNSKASNIIKTCRLLLDVYDSRIPQTRAELQALPGVGRKTANVVLNTAFGQPTMAVDTHIFRVANRTGLAKGNTPLAVELRLLKAIDADFLQNAHHWLILHGRYVCLARKPRCGQCLIADLCEFTNKPVEKS